jgi:PAS domain S-box-containing protein
VKNNIRLLLLQLPAELSRLANFFQQRLAAEERVMRGFSTLTSGSIAQTSDLNTPGVAETGDVEQPSEAESAAQRLAAIVESSDDAIVAKDLNGVITSWNRGANRLFGYTADEAVGKPITILIPADRIDEEPAILARIRRGERIDHYETTRRRKDGSLVDISLTVSPIRNAAGAIVGASKIARDISERRRAQEQQHLLLKEMNHRVNNLFALASSIVTLSIRSADTPQKLATVVRERLGALARAHALTLPKSSNDIAGREHPTTLHALILTILSPYDDQTDLNRSRVVLTGPDIPIAGKQVMNFALLVHELATNAAKYGALSTPDGQIDIQCLADDDQFVLTWRERGGPIIDHAPDSEGFGSFLASATVRSHFGGELSREWRPEGLTIRLSISRSRLAANTSG